MNFSRFWFICPSNYQFYFLDSFCQRFWLICRNIWMFCLSLQIIVMGDMLTNPLIATEVNEIALGV